MVEQRLFPAGGLPGASSPLRGSSGWIFSIAPFSAIHFVGARHAARHMIGADRYLGRFGPGRGPDTGARQSGSAARKRRRFPRGRSRGGGTRPGNRDGGSKTPWPRPGRGTQQQEPPGIGVGRVDSRRYPPPSPVSTIWPAYMTQRLSLTRATTPRLWEMKRMPVLNSSLSSSTRSSTAASTVTSRAVVGSSMMSSDGLLSMAMAMTTRCCWPPDIWWG